MERLSMNDISLETTISRRQDVMTADMPDGELVMMSMERAMYYGMQEVAALIWHQLDKPTTAARVCEQLLTQFDDVQRDQCQREVLSFLNDLHQEKLIDVHAADAA
jgi:hypothetical protein